MKMRRRLPRRLLYVAAVLLVLLVAAVIGVRYFYNENLGPVSRSQQAQIITIPSGSNVKEIAQILADKKVIRKAWAFEWYVHSKELTDDLKAGTYAITPSNSLPQIVTTLTQGKVTTELVTILPGRRIDQVRTDLINKGFSVEAVDAALKPDQYRDLPVMAYVPAGTATLEGFLYPESFQRIEGTDPAQIIRASLKAMGAEITPKLQADFAAKGLNVFQAVTLASLVEREVSKQSERDQVAQVFLTRLAMDMSLGSDVTGLYGSVLDGRTPSVIYDSPYNTRLYKGLPPGPISTVSSGSLKAVANPAATDWVYFVSGDDGVTRFSKTLEEHESLTDQFCRKNCGRE
jgi:UPF0755 protein